MIGPAGSTLEPIVHFATRYPVTRTPCGADKGPAAREPAYVTCPGCRKWLVETGRMPAGEG